MELDIISLQKDWRVYLTPVLDKVFLPAEGLTVANFLLNIEFNNRSYKLPYEVTFKKDGIAVLDDDDYKVREICPVILKERKPTFNLIKLIRDNTVDKDFHVVAHTVCLLSTFKDFDKGIEILKDNLLPEICADAFYLEKDRHFCSNRNIPFSIGNEVLTKDLIYCPGVYFPINCKIYSHRDVAFTGHIKDCEELLFNSEKFIEFKKSIIKKQEEQTRIDGAAEHHNYFYRGGWEDDYNFYMNGNIPD